MKTPGSAGLSAAEHRQFESDRHSCDSTSVAEPFDVVPAAVVRVAGTDGGLAASIAPDLSEIGATADGFGAALAAGSRGGPPGAGASTEDVWGAAARVADSLERDIRLANRIIRPSRMALPRPTQIALRWRDDFFAWIGTRDSFACTGTAAAAALTVRVRSVS